MFTSTNSSTVLPPPPTRFPPRYYKTLFFFTQSESYLPLLASHCHLFTSLSHPPPPFAFTTLPTSTSYKYLQNRLSVSPQSLSSLHLPLQNHLPCFRRHKPQFRPSFCFAPATYPFHQTSFLYAPETRRPSPSITCALSFPVSERRRRLIPKSLPFNHGHSTFRHNRQDVDRQLRSRWYD